MTESPAIGIVVAHGGMAQGIIDAVSRIAGVEEGVLTAVSNEGCNPDQLKVRLLEVIGDRRAIVFTDLAAGSCTLAARLTCRECADIPVVTGVNLPMLLDFVFHLEMPTVELAERLVGKAQGGIKSILPTPRTDADPAATR